MLRKIFVALIVLFALALAIFGVTLTKESEYLKTVISIASFFDIMVPILGVGALVNYLWKSCNSSCSCDKE